MEPRFRSLRSGLKWSLFAAVGLVSSKVLRGAVIPKLLSPSSYGLFTSVSIFTRYLQFADLGATAYFTKMLPHSHVNEGAAEERRLVDHTFSLILLSGIPVIVYLGSVAALYSGTEQSFYRLALLALIPVTVISKLKEFFISHALGTQHYREAAIATAVNNYVSLVAVVLGVWLYGAVGGVAGLLAGEVGACAYAARASHASPRFVFDKALLENWRHKLRLFMVSISEVAAATLDQIFILKVFNATGLGFYMLGLTFGWVMESLSEVFNNAFYPKLMGMVRVSRAAAAEFAHRTLFCYLLTSLAGLPLLMWAIEVAVDLYFREYRDGLSVYHAMVFIGVSRGSMALIRRAYLALDGERRYIAYTLATSGLYAVALAAVWWQGLEFHNVVNVILAANTLFLLFFYGRLTDDRGGMFPKNVFLVVVILAVVLVYQFGVRTTASAVWHFSFPAAFLAAVIAAAGGWAWHERLLIRDYLDGRDGHEVAGAPAPVGAVPVG